MAVGNSLSEMIVFAILEKYLELQLGDFLLFGPRKETLLFMTFFFYKNVHGTGIIFFGR